MTASYGEAYVQKNMFIAVVLKAPSQIPAPFRKSFSGPTDSETLGVRTT
jgi:hypothetical protein